MAFMENRMTRFLLKLACEFETPMLDDRRGVSCFQVSRHSLLIAPANYVSLAFAFTALEKLRH